MVFNDFIKDDFIQEGDGQVASASVSLPDPVTLETEEQRLKREQNDHDVLEALVTTSVTLECLLVKSGKEEECCWPVCSQV